MGFEVTYKYHEKAEKGYNTEEEKELKRKVGDPFEVVPLEKLAAAIMMQMARRDIWVVDVDVSELKKSSVNFKETDGGIVLKHKKFTLDSIAGELKMEDVATAPPPQSPIPQAPIVNNAGAPVPGASQVMPQQPQQQQVQRAQAPAIAKNGAPKRFEVFDPDPQLAGLGLVKGFTPGAKYPVYKEMRDDREDQAGRVLPMLYVTIDDNGGQRRVPEDYFVPITKGLGRAFEVGGRKPAVQGDGLVWNGVVDHGMPVGGGGGNFSGMNEMPNIRGGR
jgi:hypothetical protein